MSLSEFEIKRCEKALKKFMAQHRPPAHIRNELDLDARINDQSVELFEIRPRWDEPAEKIEMPVAKATYIKRQELWKVYWQRADLKWHAYDPLPTVKTLEEFLDAVGEDHHHCFFG